MNWTDHIEYDPETGSATWRDRSVHDFRRPGNYVTWRSKRLGKPFGTRTSRYVKGRICGTTVHLHRIAWEIVHGPIPQGMVVDHINGNGRDNRIKNLRLCRQRDNCLNKSIQKNNKCGLKGVSFRTDRNTWTARIKHGGAYLSLGCFLTKGLAALAYAKASMRYHGEFGRIR